MSFKPFSETYKFDKNVLTRDFPDYLADPIETWLHKCLSEYDLLDSARRDAELNDAFRQPLQLDLKRTFPVSRSQFVTTVMQDSDLLCNVLSYLLQKYCKQDMADFLKRILHRGSSAYTVLVTANDVQWYDTGVYELGWRVPQVVNEQSKEALEANDLLMEAWSECYKHEPNPSAAVSKSIDFLEGFLRDKYWPEKGHTPSLHQAVAKFDADPSILDFRGASFLEDRAKLIALLDGSSKIRGEHTTGQGREATQEEAEFVLHTVIYIWNLLR